MPLLDLRDALIQFIPTTPVTILDFGCGGSPYRSLFQGKYLRADFGDEGGHDHSISSDGTLPTIADQSVDIVLSTQVLEHVDSPKRYLDEARRILKPGGSLILSTHGTFPDHPCPLDLHRWTTEGLERTLSGSHFEVHSTQTLTPGLRAAWFLLDQSLLAPSPTSLAARFLRRLHLHLRPLINRWIHRVTRPTGPTQGLPLYVGLLATCGRSSVPQSET